ncbi:hypothetical protein BDV59DRAFT_142374 [Aspergillus ambiguus]|uniref:uncharacterized protein n=1 Tax=Aspergillus ambiguus TaxID=176160 RepID=UPI003CCDF3B9
MLVMGGLVRVLRCLAYGVQHTRPDIHLPESTLNVDTGINFRIQSSPQVASWLRNLQVMRVATNRPEAVVSPGYGLGTWSILSTRPLVGPSYLGLNSTPNLPWRVIICSFCSTPSPLASGPIKCARPLCPRGSDHRHCFLSVTSKILAVYQSSLLPLSGSSTRNCPIPGDFHPSQ